jgi:hypothetical protein
VEGERAAILPGLGRFPEPIVISDQNGYFLTTPRIENGQRINPSAYSLAANYFAK